MEGTLSMKEPVPGRGQSGAGHLYIHLEGKAKAKYTGNLLNRFEEFSSFGNTKVPYKCRVTGN
jgi:hypothetical protein